MAPEWDQMNPSPLVPPPLVPDQTNPSPLVRGPNEPVPFGPTIDVGWPAGAAIALVSAFGGYLA